MTADEVATLLKEENKFQLATINPDGTPHLVTMFAGLADGKIAFWTERKSQKARNLARDPRVTCLIDLGSTYFELRGITLYGTVRTVTEPAEVRAIGSLVVGRMLNIDDQDEITKLVEAAAGNRHAYIVEPVRVASWDHRKLT